MAPVAQLAVRALTREADLSSLLLKYQSNDRSNMHLPPHPSTNSPIKRGASSQDTIAVAVPHNQKKQKNDMKAHKPSTVRSGNVNEASHVEVLILNGPQTSGTTEKVDHIAEPNHDARQASRLSTSAKREKLSDSIVNTTLTSLDDFDVSQGCNVKVLNATLSCLSRVVGGLTNQTLSMSEDQAKLITEKCLEKIEYIQNRTFLSAFCAAQDSQERTFDVDIPKESFSSMVEFLLPQIQFGIEACKVVVYIYLKYRNVSTEDGIQCIADTYKTHMQDTILAIFQSRERDDDSGDLESPKPSIDSSSKKNSLRRMHMPYTYFSAVPDFEKKFSKLLYSFCAWMAKLQEWFINDSRQIANDSLAILFCFGSLAPLFLEVEVDRILQLRGFELVSTIVELKPNLCSGVMDETLSKLIRSSSGQFRRPQRIYSLPDGKSIQLVSALLMNLVQACSPNPIELVNSNHATATLAESRTLTRQMIQYLLSRATKKVRNQSVTTETEYLQLLRGIFEDIITVLPSPEFPCAEIFALVTLQIMLSVMEDEKISDVSVKAFAMDVFSIMLCRTRAPYMGKMQSISVLEAQQCVFKYLDQASSNDHSLSPAQNYLRVYWMEHSRKDDQKCNKTQIEAESTTIRKFHIAPEKECEVDRTQAVDALMWLMAAGHTPLSRAVDPLLSRVLLWFDAKEVLVRSRAIKVLSAVVQVDPSVMELEHVIHAIESRLLDPSPSVRDSVLEAVGKWLMIGESLSESYLSVLMERMLDRATSVRKRALRTLLALTPKMSIKTRIIIAEKALARLCDDEDSVIDAARRLILNLLVPSIPRAPPDIELNSTRNEIASTALRTFLSLPDQVKFKVVEQGNVFSQVLASSAPTDGFLDILRASASNGHKKLEINVADELRRRPLALIVQGIYHAIKTSPKSETHESDVSNGLRALSIISSALPDLIGSEILNFCAKYIENKNFNQESEISHENQYSGLQVLKNSLDIPFSPPISTRLLSELELETCKVIQGGPLSSVGTAVSVLSQISKRLGNMDRTKKLAISCMKSLKECEASLRESRKLPTKIHEGHVRRLITIICALPSSTDLSQMGLDPESLGNMLMYLADSDSLSESTRGIAIRAIGSVACQHSKLFLQPSILDLIQRILRSKIESPRLVESLLETLSTFITHEDSQVSRKSKSGMFSFQHWHNLFLRFLTLKFLRG
jgi:hypothetical protein